MFDSNLQHAQWKLLDLGQCGSEVDIEHPSEDHVPIYASLVFLLPCTTAYLPSNGRTPAFMYSGPPCITPSLPSPCLDPILSHSMQCLYFTFRLPQNIVIRGNFAAYVPPVSLLHSGILEGFAIRIAAAGATTD